MNRIVIEAVPQHAMREPYNASEQGGDWLYNENGDLEIRVIGESLDDPEAFLFGLHELCEAYLCRRKGVDQAAVDAFDLQFERERLAGERGEDDEPGDDPRAPYRVQHRAACLIEFMMAWFLGINDYGTVR